MLAIDRIGHPWSPAGRQLTGGLVALITLFASETLAVATIMPRVADDLGRSGYGAAFSGFFLGSVAGVLLGGPAADRFRPGPLLTVLATLFTAGLLLGASAPIIWVLVAGRILQGLGAGATTPLVYTVIARAYEETARVRMFAITSTAWVTPAVFGPGLAGVVADTVGWRWVFLGIVPLVIAATAITAPAVRRWTAPADAERTRLPIAPALTATAGIGLVLGGIDARHVVVTPVLVVAGIVIASPAVRRLVPAGTVRLARGLPAIIGTRGILTASFVACDAFVPLAMTDVRGRSVLLGSLAVSGSTIAWTAGAWLADRWITTLKASGLIRIGFTVLTVGNAITLLLLVRGAPVALGIVGATIAGLGIGTAYSPASAAVLELAADGEEGRTSSALALFDGIGFAVGAAIVGALVAGSGDASPGGPLAGAWIGSAVFAALGIVLAGRTRTTSSFA